MHAWWTGDGWLDNTTQVMLPTRDEHCKLSRIMICGNMEHKPTSQMGWLMLFKTKATCSSQLLGCWTPGSAQPAAKNAAWHGWTGRQI